MLGLIYEYDPVTWETQSPCKLLRFTLPENGGIIELEEAADLGVWSTLYAQMALDEDQNAAYILRNTFEGVSDAEILTYDFEADELVVTGKTMAYSAFFLTDDTTADENGIVRTQPNSVTLSQSTMNLFQSDTKILTTEVLPWCLTDKDVIWSSSDPSVATVDQRGYVTGVSVGIATITAASVLDERVSGSCEVAVLGDDFAFWGVGNTEFGESRLFSFDLNWNSVTPGALVADQNGAPVSAGSAAMDADGYVWIQDVQTDEAGAGYRLHRVDPDTGGSSYDSEPNSNDYQSKSMAFSDLIYDKQNQLLLGVDGSGNLFLGEILRQTT